MIQPAAAPRFSRTAVTVDRGAPWPGEHTIEALTDWGIGADAQRDLLHDKIVVQRTQLAG